MYSCYVGHKVLLTQTSQASWTCCFGSLCFISSIYLVTMASLSSCPSTWHCTWVMGSSPEIHLVSTTSDYNPLTSPCPGRSSCLGHICQCEKGHQWGQSEEAEGGQRWGGWVRNDWWCFRQQLGWNNSHISENFPLETPHLYVTFLSNISKNSSARNLLQVTRYAWVSEWVLPRKIGLEGGLMMTKWNL